MAERPRDIALLALPAALSVLLNNAFRVIDQYAVQWLGVAAQAALGSSTFVLIGFFAVWSCVSGGVGPLVARACGAGDERAVREICGNGLSGAVALSVVLAVVMAVSADGLSVVLGLDPEAGDLMARYLRWLSLLGIPAALGPVLDAIFIAQGRTALAMGLQLVATVLNVALNPIFIYELGYHIEGAAIATALSRGVATAIGLFVLFRGVRPTARDFVPSVTLTRIARLGAPVGVGIGVFALVFWAILKFSVSPLGSAANAALGIGFAVLGGLTMPFYLGMSQAVASLVGRRLGAGDREGAWQVVRRGAPVAACIGLMCTALYLLGARELCALFTDDPAVIEHAVVYGRILGLVQWVLALEMFADGVLTGSGDTRTFLWLSAPPTILQVPLAWCLAIPLGFGAVGVWWAMNAATIVKMIAKAWAVRRRGWMKLEI